MINNKFDVKETVYITIGSNIHECTIKEIIISSGTPKYNLLDKNIPISCLYTRLETDIFKSKDDAQKHIEKLNVQFKIITLKSKIADYAKWVSGLDVAIKNYQRCQTDIEIGLISTETNKGNERLLAVSNIGTKEILLLLKQYYKNTLDKKEKELKELEDIKNRRKKSNENYKAKVK